MIEGLALDSRFIHPGEVFVALSGGQVRGQDFIEMALERGACAVLTDQPIETELSVPVVYLPNLRMRLSAMAAEFYGHPSQSMSVVGVTGTNGKSSVVAAAGLPFAGRVRGCHWNPGRIRRDAVAETRHDHGGSDSSSSRARNVARCRCHASRDGSVESWFGPRPVEAVQFQSAVFTNLTRDHLDYHKTFEAYAQAKQRLFTELSCQTRHLNAQTRAMSLATPADSIFVPRRSGCWKCTADGLGLGIRMGVGRAAYRDLDLAGAVHRTPICHGFSHVSRVELADIARITPELTTVPGRMEGVPAARGLG